MLIPGSAAAAFAVAAAVHAVEVGRNTYGVDVLKIALACRAPLVD